MRQDRPEFRFLERRRYNRQELEQLVDLVEGGPSLLKDAQAALVNMRQQFESSGLYGILELQEIAEAQMKLGLHEDALATAGFISLVMARVNVLLKFTQQMITENRPDIARKFLRSAEQSLERLKDYKPGPYDDFTPDSIGYNQEGLDADRNWIQRLKQQLG